MRRTIVLALATLLFVSTSSAQQAATTTVPNLIRYGGTLKDVSGTPIAAATGVTFAIYKQQDGGAPVWMETQNITPDASGQYSVLLGSTTATGLPSDLFSQEEQRWLGVQIQGQAEQARVLLVSVPYAFKAHEAETLGGKSLSDFVLAKDVNAANSGAGVPSMSISGSTQTASGKSNAKSPSNLATAQGPTNFTGTTSDQIVSAVQSGTGKAIVASSSTGNAIVATTTSTTTTTNAVSGTIPGAGVAILGHASSATAQGYGIQGTSDSNIGIGLLGFATATTGSTYGLKGYSSSTGGTGVRGLSTATTGYTVGISASVASSAGTAGVFNNTAGGKILSGQNNGAEAFSVDGSGNVNTVSTYKIGGSSIVNIGSAANGNLFLGAGAGASNSTGYKNVFSGYQAGYSSNGSYNTFSGYQAGYSNTTGYWNTFSGAVTGFQNTTGCCNTFVGQFAGYYNTTGEYNTFSGLGAGYANTTGTANTFYGYDAGGTNTTGDYNTFFGLYAGLYNTTGSSDVYIANEGGASSGTESNTIRIGMQGSGATHQNVTYIAGIYNSAATPTPPFKAVCVDSDGTLFGTTPLTNCVISSRRFKEQIADMADGSSKLFQLRPVTFFYKPQYDDGSHLLQYGLIAEEVAKVYPDLVAYDKDGQPYTVKYQYLAPMLLNELQKQHAVVAAQQDVIKGQQGQLQTQGEQIADLQQRLSRLEWLIAKR